MPQAIPWMVGAEALSGANLLTAAPWVSAAGQAGQVMNLMDTLFPQEITQIPQVQPMSVPESPMAQFSLPGAVEAPIDYKVIQNLMRLPLQTR